ncbi:MAG: 16S rRNA (cytidine(1402)-2'-O)-methyltransferase [Telmatospirillum sp.]|nr:16S rRNA (cytidine(1402)-2'-O)-methyltransferase [Telmatospirillum sp.]
MRRTAATPSPTGADTSEAAPVNPALATAFAPGLYLVGTPLGNLGDMTARGAAVLAAASLVAAEDTRVARRLFSALGLAAPKIVRFDRQSTAATAAYIAAQARDQVLAFVSDAGMPGIADPGAELVKAARAAGIPVTVIPGPSAIATAVALSGLPAEPFLFLGFLPPKTGPRARRLVEFRDVAASLVLFEAPHRAGETLAALAEILGPRPAALARELTKLHEECRMGTLAELAAQCEIDPPRGEIVIVVGPPLEARAAALDEASLDAKIAAALATLGVRDAADRIAAEQGLPRRQVYARALALAGKRKA